LIFDIITPKYSLGGDVANQYTSTFSFESEEDKQILLNLIGNPKIENRIATRARILLLREEGKRQIEVGELLKVHRNTVRLWETWSGEAPDFFPLRINSCYFQLLVNRQMYMV
jgi:hypothetical protein